ncbi:MAG: hypothetical protein GY845_21820 [Planctomycetes bacterium]|nr:hypothetical protein [Planctomycetota bacterium]
MQKQPSFRHPGLAPGPIQKGRDIKTTFTVTPDSFRNLFKKTVISIQPLLDVSKIPDIAGGDSGTTGGGIPPRC